MLEPEIGDLIEDASLVGDSRRENDIEGRYAIGRHKQKRLAEVVHVAYFSSAGEWERQGKLQPPARHPRAFYLSVLSCPSPISSAARPTPPAQLMSGLLPLPLRANPP